MTTQTSHTSSDDALEPSSINGNQKTIPSLSRRSEATLPHQSEATLVHVLKKIEELDARFNKMAQFIAHQKNIPSIPSFQSPTIGKIAAALSKAQKEIGLASATGTTGRSNATALTMSDLLEAATPVLEKYELAVSFDWAYNEHEHEILIIKLVHSSGEWMSNATLLEALKTMPNEPEYQKKRSAAITYVMKNLLRTKLCIGKE